MEKEKKNSEWSGESQTKKTYYRDKHKGQT